MGFRKPVPSSVSISQKPDFLQRGGVFRLFFILFQTFSHYKIKVLLSTEVKFCFVLALYEFNLLYFFNVKLL